MNTHAVIIGKFNPIHKGHEWLIQKAIDEYGWENILIIIGSAQLGWPIKLFERIKAIEEAFPKYKGLKIDVVDDNDDDNEWIAQVRYLIWRFFDYYNKVDIIAGEEYKWQKELGTPVIWDRFSWPFPDVSSTKIREALKSKI